MSKEIERSISRMRRIRLLWEKLDHADRVFLLDSFHDQSPYEFWQVANLKVAKWEHKA